MENIIEVKNLSKKFKISHQQGGYLTLRDSLTLMFKNPVKAIRQMRQKREEFWALTDINFNVKKGETIGIIGANGAGKSTLLKILSQITPPTTGEIIMKGKAASLLEVGTGFNPELTGRENIFLNGAILGMTKQEMKDKFDKIVEFSGVEKFLDTPVKRYSSGMQVRLAFSVAAHLEPDILIVDEVLAVGDAEFQKKCLGKMDEVTKEEGRTILFVSHNMEAVRSLCAKSIYLKDGKIKMIGDTEKIISSYLSKQKDQPINQSMSQKHNRKGSGKLLLNNVYFTDENKNKVSYLISGSDNSIHVCYTKKDPDLDTMNLSLQIKDKEGQRNLFHISANVINEKLILKTSGEIVIDMQALPLQPGKYTFDLWTDKNGEILDWIQNAGKFEIRGSSYYKTNKLPPIKGGEFLINYKMKSV